MRRIWKAQILGVGMMTPALAGLPHAAAARSVDFAAHNTTDSLGVSSRDAAVRALQEGVFALTPPEKLKIGGVRIRVAEGDIRSTTKMQLSGAGADNYRRKKETHFLCKLSVSRCKQTATC